MSDAHDLLNAAWTTGDHTPLLVLADLLDERADADTAELLRLTVADGRTARRDQDRDRRLRQLRDGVWKRVKVTDWPDLSVQGHGGAASFGRRPDRTLPDRQHVVTRPGRRTVHWLVLALDREDEVLHTQSGAELLRRRLPATTLAALRRRDGFYTTPGFSLAHDFFPVLPGTPDLVASLEDRERRFERAVEPALIPVSDLPAELVPFVAGLLAGYLADRPRRARAGELVPGAHLFLFRGGRWGHAASLDLRDAERAAELLRRRVRWERDRGAAAGLLVRVADNGRVSTRKLAWWAAGQWRETDNLRSTFASLGAAEFGRAAVELGLEPGSFVLDSAEQLRGLFVPSSSAS